MCRKAGKTSDVRSRNCETFPSGQHRLTGMGSLRLAYQDTVASSSRFVPTTTTSILHAGKAILNPCARITMMVVIMPSPIKSHDRLVASTLEKARQGEIIDITRLMVSRDATIQGKDRAKELAAYDKAVSRVR